MENSTDRRFVTISTQSILNAVLVVALIALAYYIRELVFVFLTAVVISSFVESGVYKMRKRGMGRTLSVVLIYFLMLAIFGFLIYLFVPVFFAQIGDLTGVISKYLPASASTLAATSQFSNLFTNFQTIATSASGGVFQFAVTVFGGLFNFIVLIVLSFYLSINERAIESFLRLVTPNASEETVVGVWKRTERKIGRWFQGQLILGLIVGTLTYIALRIAGIEYSLLLALFAALMELIPFGIILAAIPAIAAGYLTNGTTGALVVAGIYLVIHELDLNIITPVITKRMVGLSTFVVLLAILIGLQVAGFWGVILGVPAAVLLMEIIEETKRPHDTVDIHA